MAGLLESWGIEVTRGIAGTGLVGVVHGSKTDSSTVDGVKSIGLRADMDALEMEEENAFEYKSKTPGLHHGCGHDGHTSILLGTAKHLSSIRDQFTGEVYLVFQPAEECGGGAQKMVEAGLLENFPMTEMYGLHNWPSMEPGRINVKAGPIMAAADEFEVTVTGVGGHAAFPHSTVDPLMVGAQIVSNAQTIVSRVIDPMDPAVVSITGFTCDAGANNVIPKTAKLSGTTRTFSMQARDQAEAALKRLVDNTAKAHGATAEVRYFRGYPATVNAAEQTRFARDAALEAVGESRVSEDIPSTLGAEDFAYFQRALQQKGGGGCYVWVGTASEFGLHHPRYDFDDMVLPIGVQFFVNIVKRRLS